MNPIRKKKGSAIFIHVAKKKYLPTKGCIALKKNELLKLLKLIRKNCIVEII
jgi:L,D-peptidoglycan transpeptidase YkuD (ErfK/YbiS/YcfS/YnhG family)